MAITGYNIIYYATYTIFVVRLSRVFFQEETSKNTCCF